MDIIIRNNELLFKTNEEERRNKLIFAVVYQIADADIIREKICDENSAKKYIEHIINREIAEPDTLKFVNSKYVIIPVSVNQPIYSTNISSYNSSATQFCVYRLCDSVPNEWTKNTLCAFSNGNFKLITTYEPCQCELLSNSFIDIVIEFVLKLFKIEVYPIIRIRTSIRMSKKSRLIIATDTNKKSIFSIGNSCNEIETKYGYIYTFLTMEQLPINAKICGYGLSQYKYRQVYR